MAIKTHKTKSGKTAKKGLYYNINQKKKAGTSNTKKKSTISAKAVSYTHLTLPTNREV